MAHDNGGPAFPEAFYPNRSSEAPDYRPGMTLRDWFAGHALAGMLADANTHASIARVAKETGRKPHEVFAETAYDFADVLLAERKKATP